MFLLTTCEVHTIKYSDLSFDGMLLLVNQISNHSNVNDQIISHILLHIITHLAGQTIFWHGRKWNFAGPQIYLQPAKIKSQHSGVSLKFLVCN